MQKLWNIIEENLPKGFSEDIGYAVCVLQR